MAYEANRAGQDADGQVLGDGIRPSTALPPTLLVTELDTGELVVQGRPAGPRVRLSPDDALPLRWELAAAFERAEQVVPSNDGDA
jgi:hypothetical protein